MAQVKEIQRRSPAGKKAWTDYCVSDLGDIRDPNKHDKATLQGFITWANENVEHDAEEAVDQTLVEKVKKIQRGGSDGRKAWQDYADSQLQGVRDPNRHDAASLQYFLDTYGQHAEGGGEAEVADASLVQRVKDIQRGGGDGRQAWITHADRHLEGVRDPSRHGTKALRNFLKTFEKSAASENKTQDSSEKVAADFIRIGARLSSNFKAAWKAYCSMYGSDTSNPAHYDEGQITAFADYVAEQVQNGLASSVPGDEQGDVNGQEEWDSDDGAAAEKAEQPTVAKRRAGEALEKAGGAKAPKTGDGGAQAPAAEKKKITIKKSIADEIRRLNTEGGLASQVRVGAVAGPLSQLDEAAALEILLRLEVEPVDDPTAFVCAQAREAVGAVTE